MDKSDFLEDMQNDEYINQNELDKIEELNDKKQDKLDKKQNKIDSKISKAQKLEEKQQKLQQKLEEKQIKIKFNIDNKSTEIIGKGKRQLLTKINKYKKLSKSELSDYKFKRGSTEAELQEHIINIQDLLDSNQVDMYITDSIYGAIKMIEPITNNTKYNIKGLSDMLKLNPQFTTMCQKLLLKYNCFTNTPIEYQMIMIISTSVYLTVQKNNGRQGINQYLNQKI